MKEFHFINVGVSIVSNLGNGCYEVGENLREHRLSDNEYWQSLLDNPSFLNRAFGVLREHPMQISAELNAFLKKTQHLSPEEVEVYLTATRTPVNEICARLLERFFLEEGYSVYMPREFPGYFLKIHPGENRAESFARGISELLEHLLTLVRRKREEGYVVYFNATGGFKAHIMAYAVAGFLTSSSVYYLNEEFDDLIILPPLLYFPTPRELEVLRFLKQKEEEQVTPHDLEKLWTAYAEEITNLECLGFVAFREGDGDASLEICLTSRGREMEERLR
ncbi:MAG: hypothetical protein PWP60_256 [Candidatus Atribacteria bacterium]|jgi:putative CRISPR-associated protein (TIGR02619 family)|uniref:CRISPR-associated protein n=1 Tax=Thermatribacter velox TaxID=3039681 RepID=A0ABZ2YBJ5_9BACT|nr:hypothetical protein [Candidatus Atribacteria bacterium]